MASSRKSSRSKARSPDLAAHVLAQLAPIVAPGERLVVGLSGGVDSVVLLDCLRRVSRKLRFRLAALHINHRLSAQAGRWAAFCKQLGRKQGISCSSVTVKIASGGNIEAKARAARYAAFGRYRADYIVLAQHQDDQVETLLLQLLRGAGVKGLAAMPFLRKAEGGRRKAEGKGKKTGHPSSFIPHPPILRPLLGVTRAEILDCARERSLKWIEDESNANLDLRRNFLRHEVLPLIARRFPSYRTTLARSARHLAEAGEMLDALAAQDGAGSIKGNTLSVTALRRLSNIRARNLLRFFLAGHGVMMPNTERLEEALRQALSSRRDAQVAVNLGERTLRRYQGRLHLVANVRPLPRGYARTWLGERELALPELGGVLRMKRTRGKGLSMARLGGATVTVRTRRGAERFQVRGDRPRRTLKNLLQESQIPPWRRERLPLLFCGHSLVWVPGIGVARDFRAVAGEASLEPGWVWGQEAG